MVLNYKKSHRLLQFFILSFFTLITYNNCAKPSHTLIGSNGSNGSNSQQATFKCVDRSLTSKTKNYIMSNQQYLNTITDLFGTGALSAASAPISLFGSDINDADSYERLSSIISSKAIAYYDAADSIASYITSNTTRTANVFGSCANQTSPAPTCIDNYISTFAPKIIRRPLTTVEINFVKKLMSTSGTYKENLKAVLTYHLSSPSFLWLLELGNATSTGNRLTLTPYEVATRISYMLTDSTPDDALLASANSGLILLPLELQTQIQRLLQTNRGKQKIKNSFLRWSLADQAQDVTGLPSQLLNGVQTSGLQAAMLAEANMFTDYTLFNAKGSLNELLTSKLSFASHPGLADIYGHAPVTTTPATMAERRQGLLLRAPALTDGSPNSSIIRRGVKFLNRVLCTDIPFPTVEIINNRNIRPLTPQELLTTTNRAAVAYQTNDTLCMSCHSLINPVGFVFEGFDTLGKIRNQEMKFDSTGVYFGSLPVSTNTSIPMPSGNDLTVTDAYDMVTQLAQSEELSACVTRNLFRYFYEKKESKSDDCQLQDSFDVIKENTNPAINAIEKIFTSDKIYYKEL